jgi:hypothetical protein
MASTKKVIQSDTDVNNDGIVDELDTVEIEEPKVFGYVVGRAPADQEYPI